MVVAKGASNISDMSDSGSFVAFNGATSAASWWAAAGGLNNPWVFCPKTSLKYIWNKRLNINDPSWMFSCCRKPFFLIKTQKQVCTCSTSVWVKKKIAKNGWFQANLHISSHDSQQCFGSRLEATRVSPTNRHVAWSSRMPTKRHFWWSVFSNLGHACQIVAPFVDRFLMGI